MKIETHAHTAEVSPCADVDAKNMIRAYYQAGYDAVVVTDHFKAGIVDRFPGSDKDKVERYLEGYRIAGDAGEKLGIKVFLGAEVCLAGAANDYLIFGVDELFLSDNPGMYRYTLKQLYDEVSAAGMLLVQAHPYRSFCAPQDPYLLHGAEVYNGNIRHANNNDKTLRWASGYPHMLHLSGSDYHKSADIARGGIIITEPADINCSKDFCEYLKTGSFELISRSE